MVMTKVCNYCGQYQEFDGDKFCECGGSFVIEDYDYENWKHNPAYIWEELNNIDNILEDKRRLKKGRDKYNNL